MLLAHALLLAEARSYVAALADHALTLDGALEYERALLQLDALHDGALPPTIAVPATDMELLKDLAVTAIGHLAYHGVDRLDLELCLAMLQAAHELDTRP